MKTRRQFLGESSCAAVTSLPVINTLLNLTMANHAAAAGLAAGSTRKSLVCLFLGGGNDSFNMVVPTDTTEYADYSAARTNLALNSAALHPLAATDSLGRNYGLHPALGGLAKMFNGTDEFAGKQRLSILANVGTLIEPIPDKAAYQNKLVALPQALFSHRDQVEQWQTSVPQGMEVLTGWAGRAADILHSTLNTEQTGGFYMPMNYSLAGNSTFQIGDSEGQFVITRSGALTYSGSNRTSGPDWAKNKIVKDSVSGPLEDHYRNLFHRTHGRLTSQAIERGNEFSSNFKSPGSLNGKDVNTVINNAGFPGGQLSDNLEAAVRTIAIREQLRLCRQTIFLSYGGFDNHRELLNTQYGLLDNLDQSLFAYQSALEELGIADEVITFTCSDFGRTLRSNGQGTDHAWAGNQFVLGGPVAGGQILGNYPSLAIDGPDDIGRGGRIFPKLSADEYFCELLRWFDVADGDIPLVLPNIGNFISGPINSNPIGFLA